MPGVENGNSPIHAKFIWRQYGLDSVGLRRSFYAGEIHEIKARQQPGEAVAGGAAGRNCIALAANAGWVGANP